MSYIPEKLKTRYSQGRVLKEGDWPDGAKCAVSLSISVNGPWYPLTRNLGQKAIFAAENMSIRGVERLLTLFKRYNIKGTFWVIGYLVEKYPEVFKKVYDMGHELGNYEYLRIDKTFEETKIEIEKANDILQKLTGEKPVGIKLFNFTPKTLKLLSKYGFIYEHGVAGHDLPFEVLVDGEKTGIITMPLHAEMDALMQWGCIPPVRDRVKGGLKVVMRGPSDALDLWNMEFDGCYREGLFLSTLFHPHINGKASHAIVTEKFIQHIQNHSNVWIAPLKEIAKWAINRI